MGVENNVRFTAFLYKQIGADTIKLPLTVQRIQIGFEEITSFRDLEEKLLDGFPELKRTTSDFSIYWGNAENDWILISDKLGLLTALKGTKESVCQLHVVLTSKTKPSILENFLGIF